MSYSAYVSEVFRAGILSVHPSQGAAGLALGLTRGQTLRHVIVPQAVRRVIPPLLNDFIALQKDVALVAFIGPQEAFRVANVFADQYFNYTPLMSAALLYLCVTIPLVTLFDRMQMRTIRERGGALRSDRDDAPSSNSAASRRATGNSKCSAASTSRSASTRQSR